MDVRDQLILKVLVLHRKSKRRSAVRESRPRAPPFQPSWCRISATAFASNAAPATDSCKDWKLFCCFAFALYQGLSGAFAIRASLMAGKYHGIGKSSQRRARVLDINYLAASAARELRVMLPAQRLGKLLLWLLAGAAGSVSPAPGPFFLASNPCTTH